MLYLTSRTPEFFEIVQDERLDDILDRAIFLKQKGLIVEITGDLKDGKCSLYASGEDINCKEDIAYFLQEYMEV
ncbi:hypothetical protein CL617_02045 [archaeon]|nr:hypothetical protein [archaeon]|tara:strand:- start:6886 stop:7107 length:222 start_codon:yes stop_codon:yes gene_type:complete